MSVSVCVYVCLCLCSWLREVTVRHGSNFLKIKRPFGRLLNFSSGIIGKRPSWAKSWPGGHGRSREITRGYARLRREKRRKVEEQQQRK